MRNKRLDVLRAVAVLLVLGRHVDRVAIWTRVGYAGVDLFFVLSGFLISGLLFAEYKKTGGINWKRFFIRRGFKIYPSFYLMLLATFLFRLFQHKGNALRAYLPEIFFYQSYQDYRLWGHTWSLAVEEHFYILLPALLLLLLWTQPRTKTLDPFRMIPVVFLVLATACLLQRYYLAHLLLPFDYQLNKIVYPTHLRIDGLFFGVLLGYLYHFRVDLLSRYLRGERRYLVLILSALAVSTCAIFPLSSPFMLSFGLTLLYLGFGGVLLLMLSDRQGAFLIRQSSGSKFQFGNLLAYIGMHSYSIYLWHSMVGQHYQGLCRLFWPHINATALFVVYISLSLFAGIVLSLLIEFPALQLRDQLFPTLTAPASLAKTSSSEVSLSSASAQS